MLFISPLNLIEYIGAHATTVTIKSILFFLISSGLSAYLFNYNIFALGFLPLVSILANIIIFAISLGIILLGLIFRFGTKIQALSWGCISMLQPLCAALYPLSIIPEPFKTIALAIPATYIFEGARALPVNPEKFYTDILIASILNVLILIASTYIFRALFNQSRTTGQFARNEG